MRLGGANSAAIVLAAFFIIRGFNMRLPRGIRNNNPGNIRGASFTWQGETGRDSQDFVIFEAPVYGVRAMARVIETYREKYFLVTIRQIVERWAPDSENNTESYIISVASRSGIGSDEYIEVAHIPALIEAIIYHENGQQPYTAGLIQQGIDLA